MNLDNAQEIINYIGNSVKKTPVRATISLKGDLKVELENVKVFQSSTLVILKGESEIILEFIERNRANIVDYDLEYDRRNSAIPTLDIAQINARIEPGVTIREHVAIGDNAIIMMGAVINIGAQIGNGTMIDMGAILGGRATVGANSHIGAGAVLAGVIEPPSADPVRVGNDTLIGANTVVLEGVQIGNNCVVGAGSIVTQDVPDNSVVIGSPARVVKMVDEQTKSKTQILEELRKL
ncbi:MAG: 2,3,4,5-tetrahydropyridine-2,6-dicarboxylate N-acetyltransferase [Mycoplasmatales bacterium]